MPFDLKKMYTLLRPSASVSRGPHMDGVDTVDIRQAEFSSLVFEDRIRSSKICDCSPAWY